MADEEPAEEPIPAAVPVAIASVKAVAKAKPPTAAQVFPVAASSSGKRYYVFAAAGLRGNRTPFIAAGHEVALACLGGSWTGRGTAPRGFATLEEACNELIGKTQMTSVLIHWTFPGEECLRPAQEPSTPAASGTQSRRQTQ